MKEQRIIYCSGKRLWWLVLIGMTTFSPGIHAASVDAAASRAAMQLLKAECFSCHNGEKHKGGLGTHTAGLIGSVAQGTVAAAAVPVLLVK